MKVRAKITLPERTVIAHRGASEFYPENTLEAFDGAHRLGAHWVETDVMLTGDGVAILFHDDSVLRLTGQDKDIANLSYEEVKQLDVGSWFDPRFKDAKIPTLEQGLDCLTRLNMSLNLELKPTPNQDIPTAIKAIEILRKFGFPTERLIISSFSLLALKTAYEMAPEYAYGLLADTPQDLIEGLKFPVAWNSIHINDDWADPKVIQELVDGEFQILVFTVNQPARARKLFEQGVRAIFANDPTPSAQLNYSLGA